MDHENLFYGYDQIICSSPCNRIVPSEIRGIPIPLDYRNFITRYNGAHLIYDRASIDLDEVHVVLFSLEEIISGESYTDPYGRYLGSELSMREDFQNTRLEIRTTAEDTPYDEAPKLYQSFYNDHLIIGYAWSYWEDPIRYIALLGVDRDGQYFIVDDTHIEHFSPFSRFWGPKPYAYCWQGKDLLKLLNEARSI